jgi:hypothetical protein
MSEPSDLQSPQRGANVAGRRPFFVPFLLGVATTLAGLCVLGLAVPALQKVRTAAARVQAMNQMKDIGLAVHGYQDAHAHRLPSPDTVNPPNQIKAPPVGLSWRVALLPHLKQPKPNEFDMTAAWDSPANEKRLRPMPAVYHDPLRLQDATAATTHFQYFVGPKTLWPTNTEHRRLIDISDGTSNTFLFAEAISPAPWAMPADMFVQPTPEQPVVWDLSRPLSDKPPVYPQGPPLPLPSEFFLVCFADATVRGVERAKASEAILRLYIGPADGVPIPPLD